MFFEECLPRREEHRAANIQPNPLPVVPSVWVDDRAVTDALRRRPAAGFGRGGHAVSRLAVFVVIIVVIVVVAVVVVAAVVVRRQRSDVRRFPLVVRCRCHLEGKARYNTH